MKKKIIRNLCIIFGLLIASAALHTLINGMIKKVPDQNATENWEGNYAQISCYSSKEDSFTSQELMEFEHKLNTELKDSDVSYEKKKKEESEDSVKKWMSAYSGKSEITVSHGGSSVEGVAYGISGNFFQFHPLQLLSGSYLDTDSVMHDYVLLDEESAWQLFGSSDVAGLTVEIGGEQFVVRGVYRRPDNKYNNATENGKIVYYLYYDMLEQLDEEVKITNYEITMVNPVKHYAYQYLTNYFLKTGEEESSGSSDGQTDVKRTMKIVEVSDRYSFQNRVDYLLHRNLYAMIQDDIVYPFWENIAQAYTSKISGYFLVQLCLEIFCVLIVIITLIQIYMKYKDKIKIKEWLKRLGRLLKEKGLLCIAGIKKH